MRSPARAADASDPAKNFHFSRRWSEPPEKNWTAPRIGECGNKQREIERIFARFGELSEAPA